MAARKSRGSDNTVIVVVIAVLLFVFTKNGSAALPDWRSLPSLPSGSSTGASAGPVHSATIAGVPDSDQETAVARFRAKPGPKASNTTEPLPNLQLARQELASLPVQKRVTSGGGYERKLYGPRWADTDRNRCNQRDDVLYRDVIKAQPYTAAQQKSCRHDMIAGTWSDPYTGMAMTFTNLKETKQAEALQIDHTVSLADAHRYGGAGWSPDKRLRFQTWMPHLVANYGPDNRFKSDSDPASWKPKKTQQCRYAKLYIHTKYVWGLATDKAQVRGLNDMLATCKA